MNNIRRHFVLAPVALSALALMSGCGSKKESSQAAAEKPAKRTPILADGYHGFWRRNGQSPQVDTKAQWMMVFFDPMCPHCLTFWETAAEANIPQLWVPVDVLRRPMGGDIGAWLLEASKPDEDFVAIKTALMNAQPFEVYPAPEAKAWLTGNTTRFNQSGQRGVPTIVSFHPDREPRVNNGGLPRDVLKAFIGA